MDEVPCRHFLDLLLWDSRKLNHLCRCMTLPLHGVEEPPSLWGHEPWETWSGIHREINRKVNIGNKEILFGQLHSFIKGVKHSVRSFNSLRRINDRLNSTLLPVGQLQVYESLNLSQSFFFFFFVCLNHSLRNIHCRQMVTFRCCCWRLDRK